MSQIASGRIHTRPDAPLVFATDGSVARKRRHREHLTGWGYMSLDGRWAAANCPQPTSLSGTDPATVAELRAIWHAVGELIPTTPVLVLTDSQRACRLIEAWQHGEPVMPAGYLGSQRHTPRLVVMAEQVARHPHNLTVEWVKGHAGLLLNEGADCLARLGCRWLVERMRREAVEERARFVAEGFLADSRINALPAVA